MGAAQAGAAQAPGGGGSGALVAALEAQERLLERQAEALERQAAALERHSDLLRRQVGAFEQQVVQQEGFLVLQQLQLLTMESMDAQRRLEQASSEVTMRGEHVRNMEVELEMMRDRAREARSARGGIGGIEIDDAELERQADRIEHQIENTRVVLSGAELDLQEARARAERISLREAELRERLDAILTLADRRSREDASSE